MSDLPDRQAEQDWTPQLGDPPPTEERFKWGWNGETAEATVWPVFGPGDGLPSHELQLSRAWGRRPNPSEGDAVGIASRQPARVSVQAYYGRPVPAEVLAWFRARYPHARLVVRS